MIKSSSSRRSLLIFLGILLVAGGIGVNVLLPNLLNPPAPLTTGSQLATAPVVVTAGQLVAGTKLDTSNLTIASYPVNEIPTGAFSSISQVAGKFSNTALALHTPVTPEMLVSAASAASQITYNPLDLPEGDVPYTVEYDAKSMAYFVPGDHVDILVAPTPSGASFYALTDLTILRLGNPADPAATPSTMVLQLTRGQALDVADIINGTFRGQGVKLIRWVLRSHADG